MTKLGFTLSSEEFGPQELIKFSKAAEEAGFDFVSISDHFHPWIDNQGQSPFVWSVIGGIAQTTKNIKVMTGVTCPIIRIHPAIIAQAAATSQVMLEGRFMLGIGTGENLNEHVVGEGWPTYPIRHDMLIESIEIMKRLWKGGYQDYYGSFYVVDMARIYTLPKEEIPILVSAYGKKSAKLAGQKGDGFVSTSPKKEIIQEFERNGGKDKPKYGQMTVCFANSVEKATQIMKTQWPLKGIPSPLNTELRLPKYFESVSKLVSEDEATKEVPLGPDIEMILQTIHTYKESGFDHIYIHNIGPYQEEFLDFFTKKVSPKLL